MDKVTYSFNRLYQSIEVLSKDTWAVTVNLNTGYIGLTRNLAALTKNGIDVDGPILKALCKRNEVDFELLITAYMLI